MMAIEMEKERVQKMEIEMEKKKAKRKQYISIIWKIWWIGLILIFIKLAMQTWAIKFG